MFKVAICRFSICNVVAVALLLSAGCGKSAPEKAAAPETDKVSLAPAKLQDAQRSIEVVGTLFGDEEALISAKVAGRMVKTMADLGDRLPAGEPLAQIDPIDYQLAYRQSETLLMQTLASLGLKALPGPDFCPESTPTVEQARLQADNGEARFRRAEKLFKQQPPSISAQDYDDSKTTAAVARSAFDVAVLSARALVAQARTRQAELDVADQRLADTVVRAPQANGREYAVAAKLVSVGEYVKEGTPLFRVVADNPIRFRAAVPQRYLADIKLGQKVDVTVEAYAHAALGEVRRINPQVDSESRAFFIEVNIDNKDGLLRPGAFARGLIATHIQQNVLFVPEQAVVTFAGIRKVFTVADGKAVENQVAIGDRNGGFVEIVSGMKGAPEVIVSGADKLAGGTAVQVTSPTTKP